jgi:hypothetical protein
LHDQFAQLKRYTFFPDDMNTLYQTLIRDGSYFTFNFLALVVGFLVVQAAVHFSEREPAHGHLYF